MTNGISIVTPLMRVKRGSRLRNWKVVHAHLKPLLRDRSYELEWIVPEQGSTVGSRWGTTKVAVYGPKNRSQMRNIGWRNAKHDMICFLDSDIVMEQSSWRHAMEECHQHQVYSPYRRGIKLGPRQTNNRIDQLVTGKWHFSKRGHQAWNLCGGICFMRREVLEECDGWDEEFNGWGYEDIALEKLVKLRFEYHSDAMLAIHLFHPTSPAKRWDAAKMRRRFRTEYSCRQFDDIMQRRRYYRRYVRQQWRDVRKLLEGSVEQPKITEVAAVTSLTIGEAPRKRQIQCLASWKRLGLDIHVLTPPGHKEWLSKVYHDVTFHEVSHVHRVYSNRVCINDHALLADTLDKPVILINSDIEIYQSQEQFRQQWVDTPDDVLQFGIRWNYDNSIFTASEEGWGIDAFRFTPKMARQLPIERGFGIGLPVWDYWLPYQYHRLGYRLRADWRPVMFHKTHFINWTRADHHFGKILIERLFGIPARFDKAWTLNDWIVKMRVTAKALAMEDTSSAQNLV